MNIILILVGLLLHLGLSQIEKQEISQPQACYYSLGNIYNHSHYNFKLLETNFDKMKQATQQNISQYITVEGWQQYTPSQQSFADEFFISLSWDNITSQNLTLIQNTTQQYKKYMENISLSEIQFAFGNQFKLVKVPQGHEIIALRFQLSSNPYNVTNPQIHSRPYGNWSVFLVVVQTNKADQRLIEYIELYEKLMTTYKLSSLNVTSNLNIIPKFTAMSLKSNYLHESDNRTEGTIIMEGFIIKYASGSYFLKGNILNGQPDIQQLRSKKKEQTQCKIKIQDSNSQL